VNVHIFYTNSLNSEKPNTQTKKKREGVHTSATSCRVCQVVSQPFLQFHCARIFGLFLVRPRVRRGSIVKVEPTTQESAISIDAKTQMAVGLKEIKGSIWS